MISSSANSLPVGSIYEQLRTDIIRASFGPGEKLKVEDLRSRYRTSGSPVREALSRLAAEGLVEQKDNRGFRVAGASLAELIELTRTRHWIDEIALRDSITCGDRAWEEGLVLALFRLSRAPEELTSEGRKHPMWTRYHREFHVALLASCSSKMLLNFSTALFDSAERYREIAARKISNAERDVHGEHREIMEAALDRDVERASVLLGNHIDVTAKSIENIL